MPPRGNGIALVLAGGGARGAYEIGALSALLPALEQRGERPEVIVGTSVGAINAAYLAATAGDTVEQSLEQATRLWSELSFDDVLRPLLSGSELRTALGSVGQFLGIPGARVWSLLDPAPLSRTLRERVPLRRIHANIASRTLTAAAVVATSARTSSSVVFHDGGGRIRPDRERAIEYVPSRLGLDQVRASAAIPGVFPAVRVAHPHAAAGWYYDGGTRLNTPIKPALALGGRRVIVIALNSLGSAGVRGRPEALDGASQIAQALLVDPLVHDVQTLATINAILRAPAPAPARGARAGKYDPVPYILIAPREPNEIGAIAQRVFREHYSGVISAASAPSVALLGRAFEAASSAARGELFSYLFFAREFADALLAQGAADARRWLTRSHDDGPWRLRKP
jgi:NTE family protein